MNYEAMMIEPKLVAQVTQLFWVFPHNELFQRRLIFHPDLNWLMMVNKMTLIFDCWINNSLMNRKNYLKIVSSLHLVHNTPSKSPCEKRFQNCHCKQKSFLNRHPKQICFIILIPGKIIPKLNKNNIVPKQSQANP